MAPISLCLLVVVFHPAVIKTGDASQPDKPNIVFIVADDLGWNDVGWRDSFMVTPTLDRLAREGVILNNSYVQPLCSPTRSALLSGYFPYHIGRQHSVILWRKKSFLDPDLKLLPESLRDMGYATHIVGKWHLGFCNWNYTPTYRGFDSFYGFYNADEDYYTHEARGGYDFRKNKKVEWEAAGTYVTQLFTDRALEIVRTHDKATPLFLYLPFSAPHFPLQVPEHYEEQCSHIEDERRRIYCGMVAAMDEGVGRLVDTMEEVGLMDNTLLVFTSDNGGDPREAGYNWPLRGAKQTLWEGGTRAVGFVYSKTLLPNPGTAHEGMMHVVDWYPTLMSLVGGRAPPGIDGISQWHSIRNGADSPRDEFVYNIDEMDNNAAIRMGDWKLIQGSPGDQNDWYPPPEAGNGQRPNFSFDGVNDPEYRLFNIKDDPTEQHDVKDQHMDVLKKMKARLRKWRESLVPANFPPDDPASDPANFGGVWSPGWC